MMSYEGSVEYLCEVGHYTCVLIHDIVPMRCSICGAPQEWEHPIDETNGVDDADPGTYPAVVYENPPEPKTFRPGPGWSKISKKGYVDDWLGPTDKTVANKAADEMIAVEINGLLTILEEAISAATTGWDARTMDRTTWLKEARDLVASIRSTSPIPPRTRGA